MDMNVVIGIGITIAVALPLIISFISKPVERKSAGKKLIKKTN